MPAFAFMYTAVHVDPEKGACYTLHNPNVHHTLQLAFSGLAAVTAFMTDVFGGYVDEVKKTLDSSQKNCKP